MVEGELRSDEAEGGIADEPKPIGRRGLVLFVRRMINCARRLFLFLPRFSAPFPRGRLHYLLPAFCYAFSNAAVEYGLHVLEGSGVFSHVVRYAVYSYGVRRTSTVYGVRSYVHRVAQFTRRATCSFPQGITMCSDLCTVHGGRRSLELTTLTTRLTIHVLHQ